SDSFEKPDDDDDFLENSYDEEEDEDDFLYESGNDTSATPSRSDADSDDDDFLGMTGGIAASPTAAQQAQQHVDDISFDEWWGTTFLRLSLRVWFWIGIGLFVTFVLTVVTLEVMKAYEVGPYKTQSNAGSTENT
ncbi:MAG: hypothetical protein HN345_12730, partial [Planctomycetaceae bacterium]|nr:hypothetical protein [Planctomycetaceae bacterium]